MDAEVTLPNGYTAQKLMQIRDVVRQAPAEHRQVLQNIGLLASSGVNSHHVARIVPMLLRKIIPIDIAGFFWSNQVGEMVDAYVETPYFLSADVLLSCMRFQNEEKGNWPSFTENVLLGPVAGYLQRYQTPHFYESEHFKFTYGRINMQHISDAVVHDGIRPYGSFLLMRSRQSGVFTDDDLHTLKLAMSLLPSAFHFASNSHVPTKRTYDLGILVVDKMLTRLFCNLIAHQILWMMTRDVSMPLKFDSNDQIDNLIKMSCAMGVKQAILQGTYTETKFCHWGEFLIKYIYDSEHETVAINLQQMQPYPCHLAIKLNQESLTPVRTTVTWLLLNGYVRKEIAQLLKIVDLTCAEHIQEVFNYFNVNSTNELILKIYR